MTNSLSGADGFGFSSSMAVGSVNGVLLAAPYERPSLPRIIAETPVFDCVYATRRRLPSHPS